MYVESSASKKLFGSIIDIVRMTIGSEFEKFKPYFDEDNESSEDDSEDDSEEDEEELTMEEAAAGLSALFK